MKILSPTLLLPLFVVVTNVIFSQTVDYTSPKDNSILVSLNTNIILKSQENIDPSSVSPNEFSVVGSVSGVHAGIVRLSDDNKTILFIPSSQFAANEDVRVIVNQGIKTTGGETLPSITIRFRTTPLTKRININPLALLGDATLYKPAAASQIPKSIARVTSTNSLPSDFPKITIGTSNNPADGQIFLDNDNATFSPTDSIGNFIMILNNDGSVVKYKRTDQPALDFKVQPNGELSYADIITLANGYFAVRWIVVDTTLTPTDTIQCGNGYTADTHDFLLLPNGHALVFASDPEPVDMSQVVPGGDPSAVVIGAAIQELDASKNVVFQWRSWDYLPITDSYASLNTSTVDLIHGNALEVDENGNVLFSMRSLSSIIKIDRQTGNIDWILGGKQNQFTFLNEHESNSPNYFSFQHDIRELPNGDITLFDNGNQHTPPYSRAAEYKLDEQSRTADLVWEYRHTPDIYNFAMGSVQRLSNGNTLIGWGFASSTGSPAVTEVRPDTSIALELYLPEGQTSYRAYKFPWISETPKASVTFEILKGNTYTFDNGTDTTGVKITFSSLASSVYANATVTSYGYAPINPTFTTTAPDMASNYFKIVGAGISSYTGDVSVNLKYYPAVVLPKETIVYERSGSNTTFVALPTSYDSTKNELTFTTSTLGDFAFGVPQTIDSAYAPVPISPKDSEFVNGKAPVTFVWGTRGIVQTYHLQVSTNTSFGNLVVDNSSLTSTSFSLNSVNNNSTYYWRVNNTNAAGTSNWSDVVSFNTASPFIKVLSPNGGEEIYLDSTYVIRWQSNINDTVRIELMSGNNAASVIGDSIVSGTNAFLWHVPSNLQQGSDYKVIVASISNASLSDSSNSTFTISTVATGVTELTNTVKSYALYQNYPNPFNPTTTIQFSVPQPARVIVKVYTVLGQEVARLVDGVKSPGVYTATWDASMVGSGIYFCTLSSGKYQSTIKMILLK
jgi:hypothetical protein